MSNCRDKELQLACFTPSDGSDSVSINHTVVYDNDGTPIATYFSDREGVIIDETAYLGGGNATVGECPCGSCEDCGPETNADGDIETIPVAIESQPTSGFASVTTAISGTGNSFTGGLPATLSSCGGEVVVDTLIDPVVPSGTTQFTMNWETLALTQGRAAAWAFDLVTGDTLPLVTASEVFNAAGNMGTTGNVVGPAFATWTVPATVNTSDIRVVFAIIGGGNTDPTRCDTTNLISTVSQGVFENSKSLLTVGCNDDRRDNILALIAENTTPVPSIQCEIEWQAICDDLGGGVVVQFFRAVQICSENGQVVSQGSVGDFESDLVTEYTIQGTEVTCGNAQFPDTTQEVYCDQGNSNTQFIRFTTIVAGTNIVVVDTESDGVTPYVPVGPVSIGQCPITGPDFTTPIVMPQVCVSVNGVTEFATPVVLFTGVYNAPTYFDRMGVEITDVVTAADACDCDCSCPEIEASFCMEGFDYYEEGDYTLGQTTEFEVLIDGVSQGVLNIDYLAIGDGVNKSTWYTPLTSLVNSQSGWTMVVNQDAGVNTTQRPIWSFDYSGSGASTLAIREINDIRQMVVNSDSTTSTSAEENGNPFGTNPFDATCN